MKIKLAEFQKRTINTLMTAMEDTKKEIILKSPTGSGKTIILTHFMNRFLNENHNTVFVWLTPGKGNLEEQSKQKMDLYVHGAKTKLLEDVMSGGFNKDECAFINWEKLTKKGNRAMSDSERTNFIEWIGKALNKGVNFKVIIDESHQNFTAKADEVIQLFKTDKIIRCSATPIKNNKAYNIEVTEEEVIAEGLIKKLIVTNEDFPNIITASDHTHYLLEQALNKQLQLKSLLLSKGSNVNPLIIVQLPNSSDSLLSSIEDYFVNSGISYDNQKLALWLSGRHLNLDGLTENDATQDVVIIKQAVATGWDCPRAYILVKLRDNMEETFEIQTVGRIRRMAEAKHYENDVLDSCYIYTFDDKFIKGVKESLGKGALDAKTLFLKSEFKSISLIKEQRSEFKSADAKTAQKALIEFYKNKYNLTSDKNKNLKIMESNGYIFDDSIVKYTISGEVVNLNDLSDKDRFTAIAVKTPLNTHTHGRDYHHFVAKLGNDIHLEYQFTNAIILRLFGDKMAFGNKFVKMTTKQTYSFVINNYDLLSKDFQEAMAAELQKISLRMVTTVDKSFTIPQSVLFTFDSTRKNQKEYSKNVYQGYLASAEKRSMGESKFEKFCEESSAVDWFYKNGDKGEEYLSIVYVDNSGSQKLFYPDYVVSVHNEIYIIETKGGFSRGGESQDIDRFSSKKFSVLKNYLNKHSLKGGFVRFDSAEDMLCICTDNYTDDMNTPSWQDINDIIK